MKPNVPQLLTRKEAAEVLRISVRMLDKMVRAGSLRVVRPGGSRRVLVPADEIASIVKGERE